MSYGLVQSGHTFKNEGMQGLSDVSRLSESRDQQNKMLKEQKKATETNAMLSGATSGALLGAQYGTAAGPMGTIIGGAIGLAAGWLLS